MLWLSTGNQVNIFFEFLNRIDHEWTLAPGINKQKFLICM